MNTIKTKEKTVKVLVSLKESDAKKLKEIKTRTGQNSSRIVRTLIRNEFALMV